jgi:hypothetical protein
MNASYEVIRDMRLINKFIKLGFVKPAPETGSKITGLYGGKPFVCTYIDEANRFEYNGRKYFEKYFDGCFYPYLCVEH